MAYLRYVCRVVVVAFRHSLSITQNIIFVAVLLVGLVIWYAPGPHMGVDLTVWLPTLSGWRIAFMVTALIVGGRLMLAPYWLHQELQATIAEQRALLETDTVSQNSLHHAVQIEFQQTEPFMRRKVFSAGNARFEVYVKITNAGNGFLSECVTSIVDIMPRPATDIYTILSPLTTLAKGEHRYVLVAGFNEVKGTNGQRVYNDLVTFAFATGGFTTLEPPTADAPAIITVEAKALECRTERKQFKLWVGENRRLFMADA